MRQVGNLIVYEAPDSPQWKFGDSDTCVRTFTGPYEALFAMRPANGDTMEGTGDTMVVKDGTLRKAKLGQGVLTVNLVGTNPGSTAGSGPDEPLSIVVEIDWVAVQKDLRTHPMFAEGGAHAIDAEGWAKLEKWKNEPDYKLKMGIAYDGLHYAFKDVDESEILIEGALKFYADKILKGVEAYNIYAPVVRKTSTFQEQPAAGSAGFLGDPDVSPSIPDGYEWLKTACRDVQNQDKTWQRQEEWTGAAEWDTDIYSATPPASATAPVPASIPPINHQP